MPGGELRHSLEIREAVSDVDLVAVFEIRRRVFVDEQKVPLEHERDEVDDRAVHLLAVLDDLPVATARLFVDREDRRTAWVGRMAVLPGSRRTGVATGILRYFIEWSRKNGMRRIRLHAQEYVCGLYRNLGFEPFGGTFMEENIPHVEMILELA